jgi:hypothetical protein
MPPSTTVSECRQGYTDAHKFDPERFSPERQEDVKFASNFLVGDAFERMAPELVLAGKFCERGGGS